jgi:hypothetical protein
VSIQASDIPETTSVNQTDLPKNNKQARQELGMGLAAKKNITYSSIPRKLSTPVVGPTTPCIEEHLFCCIHTLHLDSGFVSSVCRDSVWVVLHSRSPVCNLNLLGPGVPVLQLKQVVQDHVVGGPWCIGSRSAAMASWTGYRLRRRTRHRVSRWTRCRTWCRARVRGLRR